MNIDKKRYLMELKALISFMDADEKAATLSAYSRLFEQVGEDGEQQLIEELGSPVRLVLKLEKSYRNGSFAETLRELEARLAQENETEEALSENEEEVFAEEPELAVEAEIAEESEEPIEEEPELPAEEAEEAQVPVSPAEEEEIEQIAEESIPQLPVPMEEDEEAPAEEVAEEESEDEDAPMVEEFPAWAEEAAEEEETEDESEPFCVFERDEGIADDEEEEYEEYVEEKPSAGAVVLAVVCTPLILALAALMLAVSLALSLIPGVVAAFFGAVGTYFTGYALASMQYIPDMLMVLGGGVFCFGLTVLFLNWTLQILGLGIKITFDLVFDIYGKLLGKERPDE